MNEQMTLTLTGGVVMPMAGIGTFLLSPDEAEASCVSALAGGCRLIDTANAYVNEQADAVEKTLKLPEALQAPVEEGQAVGVVEYHIGGEKLGELPVVTAGSVRDAKFGDYVRKVAGALFMQERGVEDGMEEKDINHVEGQTQGDNEMEETWESGSSMEAGTEEAA